MDADLVRRYRFFRDWTSWVGHSAEQALALARAEKKGEERGLAYRMVDEDEAWDGETPAPDHLLCVFVIDEADDTKPLASIGMVGVDSLSDPYLRVVGAELMAEVFSGILADGKPDARCEPAELRL